MDIILFIIFVKSYENFSIFILLDMMILFIPNPQERGVLRCHEHTSMLDQWKLTPKQI